MPAEMPEIDNRRASFRLEDDVIIRVRLLDEDARQAIEADFESFRIRYCLKSHVQNQISLRKPQLAHIKKSKADVADYLSSLEDQVVLLAERLDILSVSSSDGVEGKSRVTLSSTGILFQTNVALESGQDIELGLLLSTVNTQVVTVAKVLGVKSLEDGEFEVTAQYSQIHAEDIEVIACHLANLQRMELQTRRENNETQE